MSVLRAVGGWDAWNVTEDADLGLRLFRFGHRIDCLDSTTFEAPPHELPVWFKQRRRWMKGWMQTFMVIARDGPNVVRDLGLARTGLLALMLVNLVASPLVLPAFAILVVGDLACNGIPTPHGMRETLEATLAASVLIMGTASTLWCGWEGLRKARLRRLWPDLALLLPYQLLIAAATLMALWDLVRRPHHWHKTPHGRTTSHRSVH